MDTVTTGVFLQINYWAVIAAALATFFLGGLWYSPALFEAAWMSANGYNELQVKEMQESLGALGFGGAVVAYLVMAMVFAMLAEILGVSSLGGGVLLGIAIWAGFVATAGLAANLFSLRPLAAWLIDSGFQLAYLSMTGAIIGIWR